MLGLCQTVMADVKEFKKDVPLISILCNPGIRERHWHKMSDICGRDITPDAGTTLRKMKKMGLEEFMDQECVFKVKIFYLKIYGYRFEQEFRT